MTKKEFMRIQDREYDYGGNWKKTLDRDKWTCQHCGTDLKGRRLAVHHKDGKGHSVLKKKANNKLTNLISLCHSCHKIVHRTNSKHYNIKWLKQQLNKGLTHTQIARICGVNSGSIYYFIKRYVLKDVRKGLGL